MSWPVRHSTAHHCVCFFLSFSSSLPPSSLSLFFLFSSPFTVCVCYWIVKLEKEREAALACLLPLHHVTVSANDRPPLTAAAAIRSFCLENFPPTIAQGRASLSMMVRKMSSLSCLLSSSCFFTKTDQPPTHTYFSVARDPFLTRVVFAFSVS